MDWGALVGHSLPETDCRSAWPCAPTPVLEIKLQRELDLARVVRCKARGATLPEVSVEEVARARHGYDAVAAKVRRIERGVVEYVEELTPELEPEPLAQLEVLEQRVVQLKDARTVKLRRRSA